MAIQKQLAEYRRINPLQKKTDVKLRVTAGTARAVDEHRAVLLSEAMASAADTIAHEETLILEGR